MDANQGRRKQKSSAKIYFLNNLFILIFTIVIVNEQINGLNYDKPRSRGGGGGLCGQDTEKQTNMTKKNHFTIILK